MPDELLCPIHGPYDASYGACPYCSKDYPHPPTPVPMDQDEMPTTLDRPQHHPVTNDIDQVTSTPLSRRQTRQKGFLDLNDEEDDNQDFLAQEDLTLVDREQTGLPKGSRLLGILWIKEGDRRGRAYNIKDGAIIGRKSGALILDDAKVSNPHARLTVENDQFVIWDFGSRNGTFVNGERIRAATPLKENDTIKIGETVFVLKVLA